MEKQRGPAEPKIHESLDNLCREGFYGELTFYFQNGNIESVRQTERLGKKEFMEKRGAEKEGKGRVLVIPRKNPQEAG